MAVAVMCLAACAETPEKRDQAMAAPLPPVCGGDLARKCDVCVTDCSDAMCTLNRNACDPRGVPLGLPYASMYRRCASDCSYKVNGVPVPDRSSSENEKKAADPPCLCLQPRPIPGAF
jgi:hypothetical protein